MKKINTFYVLTLLCLLTVTCSYAQVMEAKKIMSKGEQSSISLDLQGVSAEYADDVYKDFIKEYKGKIKKDKKANEWFSDDAKIASIANGAPIDIYSKIESSGNSAKINMWVDLGTGYINSSTYPKEYEEGQKLLNKFAQTVKVRQAEDDLAALEKEMKKLDGDMKKLKNNNDDYHKDIEKCNQKIKEAQDNIVKNEADQKNKKTMMDEQTTKIDYAKTKLDNIKRN